MFSVGLDHIHIIIMFILAFFSLKRFRSDSLAIEYQPSEGEKVQVKDNVSSEQGLEQQGEAVRESQMRQETEVAVEGQVNSNEVEVSQEVKVDQTNVITQVPLATKTIQADTENGSIQRIQDQALTFGAQKYSDQDSTLINRNQNEVDNEACCQQENEESCSSCSSSSDNSSSSSSSNIFDNVEEVTSSKVQKRKQIKKEKKKEKRQMRIMEHKTQQHQTVQIQ